ncbi:unnamed protein product [Vitrella brassicaformis CCMP3155]|uniref:U-box domain-containing protein n=1 Tax=Vitrella brassicaformis (strain CCMP3155) TaxID=1169540 RepID=A0A0G4GHJ6_VITBC|nr:unnamed protein product [Vitrella brassicaformis CCMP3155]|eukprot:CEM29211.1 unnamed protein product [Vitrella brassicaformis CCMP3155]
MRFRSVDAALIREVLDKVPDHEFPASVSRCPITLAVPRTPVNTPSGHTYELSAILRHIRDHGRDPLTEQSLGESDRAPNRYAVHHIECCAQQILDAGVGRCARVMPWRWARVATGNVGPAGSYRKARGMLVASPNRAPIGTGLMKGINALNLEPPLPKLDDITRNELIQFKQNQTRAARGAPLPADRNEKKEFLNSLGQIDARLQSLSRPTTLRPTTST